MTLNSCENAGDFWIRTGLSWLWVLEQPPIDAGSPGTNQNGSCKLYFVEQLGIGCRYLDGEEIKYGYYYIINSETGCESF
ncbi:uncharacterized protein EAF01_011684 [Botrytis porri]|uniref:uncharacterized protein n=1 Tax=Botrytis porri TaxID=87229 RepID=UPI0018FFAC69|nr:uncharacterized protein EAF01_011684 [Botrytis porri]KAF7883175.1 hypothetical protein EAF01_011684 [Botrytis porri]